MIKTTSIVIDGKQIPEGFIMLNYDRYLTHLLDPITYQEDESNVDVLCKVSNRGSAGGGWWEKKRDHHPNTFITFGGGTSVLYYW